MERPVDIQAEAAALFERFWPIARVLVLSEMPNEGALFDRYKPVFRVGMVKGFVKKIEGGWIPKKGWSTPTAPVRPVSARPTTPKPVSPVRPAPEADLSPNEARRILAYAHQQFRSSRPRE